MHGRFPADPTKPAMVMVHGAFCGGWAFDAWRQMFGARGWTTLAPDLRHHDRPAKATPHPALGRTSIADYVEDIAGLIATLPAKPVVLGHSMGGLIAQMLAARDLASAIVLLAPCPPWGLVPSTEIEVAASFSVMQLSAMLQTPVAPSYTIASEHSLHLLDPAERSRVFARFVPESGKAMFETLCWPFDIMQTTQVSPVKVACPVLAIGAGRDRINTTRTVKRIAGRYRDRADYLEFPDNSHWLIGEPGWESIAQACLDWIEERVAVA